MLILHRGIPLRCRDVSVTSLLLLFQSEGEASTSKKKKNKKNKKRQSDVGSDASFNVNGVRHYVIHISQCDARSVCLKNHALAYWF